MVRVLIFVFGLAGLLFPQSADILYMYNGEKAIIYLTKAPGLDEQVLVSRRGAGVGDFTLLNGKKPLKSVEDISAALNILAKDMKQLGRMLDAADEASVVRGVKGNGFNATVLTLIFPSAAEVAGRVYYDTTVSAGSAYEYRIEYLNGLGEKTTTFTKNVSAKVELPTPPLNLRVSSKKGIITLNWDYPKWTEDRNNIATGFRIYRREGNGAFQQVNSTVIIRNDEAENSFTDLRRDERVVYEYYITAVDPAGRESERSKVVQLTADEKLPPDAPAGLQSSASGETVFLSWNVSADPGVRGYNVYRKEDIGKDSVKLNAKPVEYSKPVFTDTTARFGKRYFYYVTALNSGNLESRLSGVASQFLEDVTPPEATAIKGAKITGKFVELTITPSASGDAAGYRIYRGERRDALAAIGITPVTAYTDSGYSGGGLLAGRRYYYAVTVIDRAENESNRSGLIDIVIPDNEAPPAPKPVSATYREGRGVDIVTGTSAAGDVKEMRVYRREGAGKPVLISTVRTFPSVVRDDSVKILATYIYMVQAVDTAGNQGEFSETAPVTIRDNTPPAAVRQVSATLKGNAVEISWIRVAENDLAGYNVYRSSIPNGVYEKINSSPVKETAYSDASGKPGMFYRIKAVDTSGNESDWSVYTGVSEVK